MLHPLTGAIIFHLVLLTLGSLPSSFVYQSTSLSVARSSGASASTGPRAFFAGGLLDDGSPSAAVDIYDSGSGRWSVASLSVPRHSLAGAGVGELVLFGGGFAPYGPSNVVDIFNATGDWIASGTLSVARYALAAAASGTKIFFAGGCTGSTSPVASNVVDSYDASTAEWFRSGITLSPGLD